MIRMDDQGFAPHAAPDAGLMPLPRAARFGAGVAVPAGAPLVVHHAAIRTARIDTALARWQALWAQTTATDPARAAAPARSATTGVPVELIVDCAAAAAPYPAFGDDERHELEIAPGRIRLAAPAEWGILRGLATLAQLTVTNCGLPAALIDDAPRFGWRGLTLDVARHFIPVDRLIATLDGMALVKLNVLHLHLTDDQGFRFPSRAYPLLASPEAYRREELERVVAHAAGLGIRVVPELDVPGHTSSWLAAYPEWGCRQGEPSRRFGVHRACLDPTNPAVDAAVGTLLAELAEIFPDAWLHVGGDEVHPEWWSTTRSVQDYMARRGFATAADLQADFNRRVAERVAALGRRTIGWDEVLHPELPATVTVQSWRGATARDRALAAGHDCVVSANYYLDLFFPADVHYGFDPEAPEAALVAREDALGDDPRLAHVAAGMRWTRHWREAGPVDRPRPLPRGRVLGAEACLWSELVDGATLDVRLWSRLPALAERFWSPAGVTDAADMRRRLRGCLAVLAASGIDVAAQSRALIARTGVQPAWLSLVDQLEPVKWYARLLGADALAARLAGREMPLARPYHADTPLDRVADALPPESFAAVDLAELCARATGGDAAAAGQLRRLAAIWSALPPSGAGPVELEPLARRLADVGRLVIDVLDGRMPPAAACERLAAAAAPAGEYVLAAVPVLAAWLGGAATRGDTR
jgi:hexosaminidase